MKTRIIILLVTAIFISANLSAIFDDYEPSPRARGLSGAFYSTSDDANAIFYNPAGLIFSQNGIFISYTKPFSNEFQELTTVAASMKLPKKYGTIGIGLISMDVNYLDVNLLSEKTFALSHSINLMKDIHSDLNFGYTFNLYHLQIGEDDEYEDNKQATFGINLGAIATLHTRTKIGFTFYNINNPVVGKDNSHELPQRIAMGISYLPYTDVTTTFELKKSLDGDTEIHAGAEVTVLEMLTFRLGARNNPDSFSAGASFDLFNIIVDYAVNTHTIGLTHHFGIGYKF
jgi:hypothetical protein